MITDWSGDVQETQNFKNAGSELKPTTRGILPKFRWAKSPCPQYPHYLRYQWVSLEPFISIPSWAHLHSLRILGMTIFGIGHSVSVGFSISHQTYLIKHRSICSSLPPWLKIWSRLSILPLLHCSSPGGDWLFSSTVSYSIPPQKAVSNNQTIPLPTAVHSSGCILSRPFAERSIDHWPTPSTTGLVARLILIRSSRGFNFLGISIRLLMIWGWI